MQTVFNFFNAALPWMVMAVVVALLAARIVQIKDGKVSDDDTVGTGMVIGLGLGIVFGAALGNTGIGMVVGMLFGMAFGSVDKSAGKRDKEAGNENE